MIFSLSGCPRFFFLSFDFHKKWCWHPSHDPTGPGFAWCVVLLLFSSTQGTFPLQSSSTVRQSSATPKTPRCSATALRATPSLQNSVSAWKIARNAFDLTRSLVSFVWECGCWGGGGGCGWVCKCSVQATVGKPSSTWLGPGSFGWHRPNRANFFFFWMCNQRLTNRQLHAPTLPKCLSARTEVVKVWCPEKKKKSAQLKLT